MIEGLDAQGAAQKIQPVLRLAATERDLRQEVEAADVIAIRGELPSGKRLGCRQVAGREAQTGNERLRLEAVDAAERALGLAELSEHSVEGCQAQTRGVVELG